MSRRYRLSLLMGCPAGGVSCTGTCSPCRCGALWGACLLCRLPPLPLVFFPAPYPPDPLPRRGRGRFLSFLMQGAPPLASPALDRLRHLQSLSSRCQAGGVPPALPARRALAVPSGGQWFRSPAYPAAVVPGGGLPSLSPANPAFSFVLAPIPPTPFPSGEGGDFLFSYARGFAPCIPGIRPPAALTEPAMQVTGGGACPPALPARRALAVPGGGAVVSVACLPCRCGSRRGACPLCRLPPLPLAFFPAPYPPDPLPRWGRGGI